ncbi:MAG: EamA family transporter [Eubacteriales bacterium]
MSYLWVGLILVYGIFKGLREALKKKAMATNSVIEVLVFYTLFAFLMIIPFSHNIFAISYRYHIAILIKSSIIFVAWLCALNSIKRLPLSVYSVMDMARVIFSILLGVLLLGESIGILQGIGMVLVIAGITLVNLKSKQAPTERPSKLVIVLVLISCLLNSVSGIMDKWLLSTQGGRWFLGDEVITSSQLQFWYMLYLTILYIAYALIKREKINVKKCVTCPWIWLLSLLFVVADRALFVANASPDSTVVVMTLIKQSSVLVTIAMGKIMYKEQHILYRILCAVLIIAGIVLSVL